MKRKTIKFKLGKYKFKMQQVFPSDLLTVTWPLSGYRLTSSSDSKKSGKGKKLEFKTGKKTKEEIASSLSVNTLISKSIIYPELSVEDLEKMEREEEGLHALLLNYVIYLCYGTEVMQDVSRDQLLLYYRLSKELSIEPFYIVFDMERKEKEWNQKRYDFNMLCVLVGIEESIKASKR